MGKTIRRMSQDEYDEGRRKFYGEYAKGPRPLKAHRYDEESFSFYDSKGPRHRKTYPMYGKR